MSNLSIKKTLNEGWNTHASRSFVFVDETRVTGKARRVGTTDFVRHRESMGHLIKFLDTLPSDPLRVLSAPCSIGCEPYSFAMLAQAAGLYAHHNLEIDALDLSPLFIEAAREGLYPAEMLSPPFPTELRSHFDNATEGMVRIGDGMKNKVNFLPAQDLTMLQTEKHYDALIVLNLLIQLHEVETAGRLAETLDRLSPPAILLNNILMVKRSGDSREVVPYAHWNLLEEALRDNGYITAATPYSNFPGYGNPPQNLQKIIPKRNDGTFLFIKPT